MRQDADLQPGHGSYVGRPSGPGSSRGNGVGQDLVLGPDHDTDSKSRGKEASGAKQVQARETGTATRCGCRRLTR